MVEGGIEGRKHVCWGGGGGQTYCMEIGGDIWQHDSNMWTCVSVSVLPAGSVTRSLS